MPSYEFGGCPACAAADHEVIATRADIIHELEALWSHFSTPPLSPDALADRLAFTQEPPLAVVRCCRCGLLYRHPRERDVRAAYAGEAVDARRLAELDQLQRPVFLALAERLTALNGGPGYGLEVGSYTGGFLEAAGRAGWRFRGVDVNAAAVAFARGRGLEVAEGSIEDSAANAAYDAVAFWNCFDQLADPPAAARAAHRRLRTGGIIAIRVPNGQFYAALRPRLHGPLARPARALLARHNLLGFPYRHGFTTGALTRLLLAADFTVIGSEPAGVLPAGSGFGADRGLAALERALRPLAGAPWLTIFARRK